MHANPVTVVHHAAAISLRGVFAHSIFIRALVEFWIGAVRRLVKQPVARTVMIRIGHIIDLRILEKLALHFRVQTRAVGDKSVFDLHCSSRKMSGVIGRPGDNTVGHT